MKLSGRRGWFVFLFPNHLLLSFFFLFLFCMHKVPLLPALQSARASPCRVGGGDRCAPGGRATAATQEPPESGATRGCVIYIRAAVVGSKTADTSGCTEGRICELEHKTPRHGSVQAKKKTQPSTHTSSHTRCHVIAGVRLSRSVVVSVSFKCRAQWHSTSRLH